MKLYKVIEIVTGRTITIVLAAGPTAALSKYMDKKIGPTINVSIKPVRG